MTKSETIFGEPVRQNDVLVPYLWNNFGPVQDLYLQVKQVNLLQYWSKLQTKFYK